MKQHNKYSGNQEKDSVLGNTKFMLIPAKGWVKVIEIIGWEAAEKLRLEYVPSNNTKSGRSLKIPKNHDAITCEKFQFSQVYRIIGKKLTDTLWDLMKGQSIMIPLYSPKNWLDIKLDNGGYPIPALKTGACQECANVKECKKPCYYTEAIIKNEERHYATENTLNWLDLNEYKADILDYKAVLTELSRGRLGHIQIEDIRAIKNYRTRAIATMLFAGLSGYEIMNLLGCTRHQLYLWITTPESKAKLPEARASFQTSRGFSIKNWRIK
jgi:hypothetical protein